MISMSADNSPPGSGTPTASRNVPWSIGGAFGLPLVSPDALGGLALPLAFVLAGTVGYFIGRLLVWVLGVLARRTRVEWDDDLAGKARRPLTLLCLAATVRCVPFVVGMGHAARAVVVHSAQAVAMVGFFWLLVRATDVASRTLEGTTWAKGNPGARTVITVGSTIAKSIVACVALVTFASALGYSVTSLVAGFGIGGVAIALAAQKTVENLFGALSIAADQPFRPGDFVNVEGTLGTVEAIGLRSTRIRTLDRTIVTLPNSLLADMRLETFAARDRIRLHTVIGVTYDVDAVGMRALLAAITASLRAHPRVSQESIVVRFKQFGESSLDIEVMIWISTTAWEEFIAIREEILLSFMELVAANGASFAFPTRTVHVIGGSEPSR